MAKITDEAKKKQLTVYLPDTRGTRISPFGIGNLKIGLGVYTYSRLPGSPDHTALGLTKVQLRRDEDLKLAGTCPGATKECQSFCYAARPVAEDDAVYNMWRKNSETEDVPMELPPDCKMLRLHISGDFSSRGYIDGWFALLSQRPDVKTWAYTRSWRVPALLPALDRLRALPNVQLFASVDTEHTNAEIESITTKYTEAGREPWRIAWIDGDHRGDRYNYNLSRIENEKPGLLGKYPLRLTMSGAKSLVCPEETGQKANCVECRYCFDGKRNDVTFLKH
jgi:hypothetical protein